MTGPARTGSVEPLKRANGTTYYRARIRLADDSRVRVDVPAQYCTPAGGMTARQRAELYAEAAQEREDDTGELLAKKQAGAAEARKTHDAHGETCDAWFERFHAYQVELGHSDVATKRSRWFKWISPRIGRKALATVTRDDIEDIRDAIDASILAWQTEGKGGDRIGGKTGMNVWSSLTSSFRAATSSKRRDLRVLEGKPNPCVGVEPPGDKDSRKSRRKTFLYPREAAALLACEAVPLEWRETYAIALYVYARPGELRVLTLADVDIDAGHIAITKAWDYDAEEIKTPKTRNGVRNIPIEAALLPLFRRMLDGKPRTALVVPMLDAFGEDHLAEKFREHLIAAKVDRDELHATTQTHVRANFRSCRDSGITWLAMSGLGVDKICRRAGHDDVNTSMGYVKLAEDLSGNLGAPFAPLPATLVGTGGPKPDGSDGAPNLTGPRTGPSGQKTGTKAVKLEREKGFEPSTSTLARWHSTTELLPHDPSATTPLRVVSAS